MARGTAASGARAAILLATYNGGAFLLPQLESIRAQTFGRIDIWVSDDGSGDGTLGVLKTFAASWDRGRFEILEGPGTGFAANFRSLLASPDIDADFVAYCDQDDVWRPAKLETAAAWLAQQDDARPALYCSRTELIDRDDRKIGLSPLFGRPPDLRNALVQSIAGGNTMVFNRAAHGLLRESARRTGFLTHDWWSYLLVTAAGGLVRYDPEPSIGYRQHDANVLGANDSWVARVSRLDLLLKGRFARWTDMNLAGLDACADLLAADKKDILREFRALRSKRLPQRLSSLRRLGVYRQTALGQASLYAACMLNRL